MVKNQRNSCCHMGCPPMIGDLHFHRGYSLRLQESKPLKNNGIISLGFVDPSAGSLQGFLRRAYLIFYYGTTLLASKTSETRSKWSGTRPTNSARTGSCEYAFRQTPILAARMQITWKTL